MGCGLQKTTEARAVPLAKRKNLTNTGEKKVNKYDNCEFGCDYFLPNGVDLGKKFMWYCEVSIVSVLRVHFPGVGI
jgi:hypothetical protein